MDVWLQFQWAKVWVIWLWLNNDIDLIIKQFVILKYALLWMTPLFKSVKEYITWCYLLIIIIIAEIRMLLLHQWPLTTILHLTVLALINLLWFILLFKRLFLILLCIYWLDIVHNLLWSVPFAPLAQLWVALLPVLVVKFVNIRRLSFRLVAPRLLPIVTLCFLLGTLHH